MSSDARRWLRRLEADAKAAQEYVGTESEDEVVKSFFTTTLQPAFDFFSPIQTKFTRPEDDYGDRQKDVEDSCL